MITINGLIISAETKPTHQAFCDIYDYMKMFHFDSAIATFNGCVSQEITLADCLESICEKQVHNYKRGLITEDIVAKTFSADKLDLDHYFVNLENYIDALELLWEITSLPIEFANASVVLDSIGCIKVIEK